MHLTNIAALNCLTCRVYEKKGNTLIDFWSVLTHSIFIVYRNNSLKYRKISLLSVKCYRFCKIDLKKNLANANQITTAGQHQIFPPLN